MSYIDMKSTLTMLSPFCRIVYQENEQEGLKIMQLLVRDLPVCNAYLLRYLWFANWVLFFLFFFLFLGCFFSYFFFSLTILLLIISSPSYHFSFAQRILARSQVAFGRQQDDARQYRNGVCPQLPVAQGL